MMRFTLRHSEGDYLTFDRLAHRKKAGYETVGRIGSISGLRAEFLRAVVLTRKNMVVGGFEEELLKTFEGRCRRAQEMTQ